VYYLMAFKRIITDKCMSLTLLNENVD